MISEDFSVKFMLKWNAYLNLKNFWKLYCKTINNVNQQNFQIPILYHINTHAYLLLKTF